LAAHASTRTTQLYDQRENRVTLDEDQYSGVSTLANAQSSWGGIGTAKDMVDALKVRFDDPQSGWMAQRAYEASSSTSPRESLCFQALSKAQHNARSMKSTATAVSTAVGTDVGRSSDIPLSHKWILII